MEDAVLSHLILVKIKPEATEEQKQALIAGFRGLSAIPGVVSCSAGTNFSARAQGYEIGCSMVFTDHDAYAGYGPHELHQSLIANLLRPISDGTLMLDYDH
jgi:hypothetical protein